MRYTITSNSLKNGIVTKRLWADDYPDALLMMDNIVDEMDGLFDKIIDPPGTLTIDELESKQYGEYHNYIEYFGRWQYVLATGWFYTGDIGSDIGKRCDPMSKLDSVMFHY